MQLLRTISADTAIEQLFSVMDAPEHGELLEGLAADVARFLRPDRPERLEELLVCLFDGEPWVCRGALSVLAAELGQSVRPILGAMLRRTRDPIILAGIGHVMLEHFESEEECSPAHLLAALDEPDREPKGLAWISVKQARELVMEQLRSKTTTDRFQTLKRAA